MNICLPRNRFRTIAAATTVALAATLGATAITPAHADPLTAAPASAASTAAGLQTAAPTSASPETTASAAAGSQTAASALAGSAASTSPASLAPGAEPYRPLVHFSPERNWMNDPNGMVFHKGVYHLYFQHNPQGDRWGT